MVTEQMSSKSNRAMNYGHLTTVKAAWRRGISWSKHSLHVGYVQPSAQDLTFDRGTERDCSCNPTCMAQAQQAVSTRVAYDGSEKCLSIIGRIEMAAIAAGRWKSTYSS